MHVAQVSFYVDPARRSPERLLDAWPSLVDIAEAARAGGVRVTVVQACTTAAVLRRADVEYRFVDAEPAGLARAPAFAALLRALRPDVVHVHGFKTPADVTALARVYGGPILIQDHAARVPRFFWRRAALRRALRAASAATFCAVEQARPFAALLSPATRVLAVPESTSRFTPGDGAAARATTDVHGNPAVLWVGHLDANKSPLVVLRGVERALERLPDLRLWCCYGSAPLLPEVERFLAARPALRARVHLLGRVPHERVESLMRAADLFVLGSRREGSGYALIEALACGLPPVVTDIPSFRALTGDGQIGHLWPVGDAHGCADALVGAARDRRLSRAAVRAHFEATLAPAALGRRWRAAYEAATAAWRARPVPA